MAPFFSSLLALLKPYSSSFNASRSSISSLVAAATCFFMVCVEQGYAQVNSVEAMPKSGWTEYREWVKQEMVYPKASLEAGVEGSVAFSFVVSAEGRVMDVKLLHSPNEELEEEARRIFSKIEWIGAMKYDNYITTQRDIEIVFKIKKYKSWVRKREYDTLPTPHLPVSANSRVYKTSEVDVVPRAVFSNPDQTIVGFIRDNLRYPEEAYRRSLSGKVTLWFVIEQSGLVSNIFPVVPLGGGLTEEAIRLLKKIKWYPGLLNNEAVRTETKLDVVFVLGNR
jgi:protein TonB